MLVAVLLFHLSILLKIVPYQVTWGGRLENDSQMIAFESVSIAVNLFFMLLLYIKGEFLKPFIPVRVVNFFLWLFLVLFTLNTIGNVLAKTTFEKLFAIVTLATVLLLWIILRKEKNK